MTNQIAERILDADTKALVEVGILSPTLAIENSTYILEFLLLENKAGLVKFAKEILKAREEAKKKQG